MKRQRQLLIHSAYWIIVFVAISLFYSFITIGSVSQGLIYAGVSLPLIAGINYFFTYWAVPHLLFEKKYMLFSLLTATIILLVLNIQIIFVFAQRFFWAENFILEGLNNIPWDIFYLMMCTFFFSIPAILYESLRNWNKKQIEINRLQQNGKRKYLEVKSDGKTQRVLINNIHYIESYGDYVHIHLESRKVISRTTLKKLDELLSNFIRTHRSYIVNPDYCRAYNFEEITIMDQKIPIGRTYKDEVTKIFNQKTIA